MIEQLVAILEQKFEDLTAEEIADILWLTLQQWQSNAATLSDRLSTSSVEPPKVEIAPPDTLAATSLPSRTPESVPTSRPSQMAELTSRPQTQTQTSNLGTPLAIPDAPSLRQPLEILKALRPLIRPVPSTEAKYLDVPTTVRAIAETDLWLLKLQPVLEPWLELAIVVDATASMVIWQHTILSLRRVLAQSGVFRDVRMWSLDRSPDRSGDRLSSEPKLCIRPGFGPAAALQSPCRPQELLDPNSRRLILVISDCIDPRWDAQQIRDMLRVWAAHGPMALVQVLPEWLWNRTALGEVVKGHVYSLTPGQSNQSLTFVRRERWRRKTPLGVKVPVLTLEPAIANQWSQMVAGKTTTSAPGLLFTSVSSQGTDLDRSLNSQNPSSAQTILTPQQRLEQFRNFSSPMARRLAGLLAACPEVNLPIVRMVQAAMLPKSQQVHVAEVLLGGLFKPQTEITVHTSANQVQYVFHEGVQPLVQDTVPPDRAFAALSKWLNHRFDCSLEDFLAYVTPEHPEHIEQIKPFAGVMLDVLKRRSGQYAEIVSRIESIYQPQYPTPSLGFSFPDLEILEFITAQLVEPATETLSHPLQTLEVEVATIERRTQRQSGFLQNLFRRGEQRNEWVIRKQRQQIQQWVEDLGDGIQLEMVVIPSGRFMMGSPEDERERFSTEGPQHEVNLDNFFMGKYPVTQAQWKAVVALSQVNRELKPDPSEFKGDNHPVERVSWHDAVEFCDRLSQRTGREYRLPTEAEWEYACRAGTQTPFHFGETLTTDLANYNGNYSYNDGPKGEYRKQTTPVDHFKLANAFGLCDMHGNVWEWCQDRWHSSYRGAPADGSAWLSENENNSRIRRGGSWINDPGNCRSACRYDDPPDNANDDVGFRVVCLAPRTS